MTNAILKSGFVRVALCASFGAMACAAFADASWQGASFDLNADWSAEANWNGDVSRGAAVATIADGKVSVDFSRRLVVILR